MSDCLVILLMLAIYIIGVFVSLFLHLLITKKSLDEGEYLYKSDLPDFYPLLSWILVIFLLWVLFAKMGTIFNRIAIWYYGDKWYKAKNV